MNNFNLIIYQFKPMYSIFKELENNLNFEIFEVTNEKNLYNQLTTLKSYLILSKKKIHNVENYLIIENFPIKLSKLLEKINIEFLKLNYLNQSKIYIKNYILDLNSREISSDNIKLKLTEKEVNSLIYLSKKNEPVNINELEKNVWKYQSDLESHTVETHIYRLRKKMSKAFDDENLIVSKKNGYQIK